LSAAEGGAWAPRAVRTVGFTFRANSRQELEELVKWIDRRLLGVRARDVQPGSDHPSWRFAYHVNGTITFELTADGPKSTRRNAVAAFRHGGCPL
jgi:hypothetical protein